MIPLKPLLSIFIGASWALAIAGALIGALSFYPLGILNTIFIAFVASLPGFFSIVLFEMASLQIEKQEELKRQTKLLESIEKLLNDKIISNN